MVNGCRTRDRAASYETECSDSQLINFSRLPVFPSLICLYELTNYIIKYINSDFLMIIVFWTTSFAVVCLNAVCFLRMSSAKGMRCGSVRPDEKCVKLYHLRALSQKFLLLFSCHCLLGQGTVHVPCELCPSSVPRMLCLYAISACHGWRPRFDPRYVTASLNNGKVTNALGDAWYQASTVGSANCTSVHSWL